MTAINYEQSKDRGWLITDAAAIGADGRVLSIESKGLRASTFDAFVMANGPQQTAEVFENMVVSRFESIDALAEEGESAFRDARAFILKQNPDFDIYTVLVAGWSQALDAPRAVAFASNLDVYWNADARTWMAPYVSDEQACAYFAALRASGGREHFDPLTHGLQLVGYQRAKRKADDEFAPNCHFVGGFAELTEITRAGISQRIIHHWPEDRAGERIRPAPVPGALAASPNVSSTNRQQRRALERQRRTVAA